MSLHDHVVTNAIASVLAPLLVLSGLAFFVVTDKYIQKIHKKTMLIILALIATLAAQDVIAYFEIKVHPNLIVRLLNDSYGYIIRPLLIVMLLYYIGGKKRYITAWCLVGVNTAVYAINLFTPIAFYITVDSAGTHYHRMALGFTCHIIGALLMFYLACLTFLEYRNRKSYIVIPFACILILVGATLIDTLLPEENSLPVSLLTIAAVICCVFFYIWIHTHLVEEYEESVIAQQRMKIMVSQIQPHFLYNTIATFKALCRTDPEKAATVAEKFGRYLRENLDSLSSEEMIPIEKELGHTRVYAEIEMVRFENIRVEYDIQDTGFSLPALTIQPIVENAIRHGVRIREEGIVRVSTRLSENDHEIVIHDNGIGFDVSAAGGGDGTHIGLENVRSRIEKLCGGTMMIESEIDKGTTVTIRIPKTERKA